MQVESEFDTSGLVDLTSVRGLPDEWDRKNIQSLIDVYDNVHPFPDPESIDMLTRGIRLKRKRQQIDYNDFNELGKETALRHTLSIPSSLLAEIKKGYPNIIKDKLQYRWFLKKFPRFRVSDRY